MLGRTCTRSQTVPILLAFIPGVAGESLDQIFLPALAAVGGLILGVLLVFGSVACAQRCFGRHRPDHNKEEAAGCVACGGAGCGLCTAPCMACDNRGCSLCTKPEAMEEAVKSGDDHAIDSPIPVEESKAWQLPCLEGDVEQSNASPPCTFLEPKASSAVPTKLVIQGRSWLEHI
ncbi:hypothetical protein AK812_SmicGene40529 [Symbiodinium microadriaticum]|uniref:Uncharacterized protein n=1 Tax=Symbiodinium microadriaticum TaxID=2951 RepID=A0A1Q9C8E2_SYMMI|nr:hypothetical protein AK812_SmicGene40529 [Symbiodinium microadriaticum]CAE7884341.1 unnamed protein product [Symbiodinium sp. KB8]CAE7903865.1 unnamed protein product [Symbiodinium microadriaticum]